eukprot:6004331-Pyramimonas_sp.AAC.1
MVRDLTKGSFDDLADQPGPDEWHDIPEGEDGPGGDQHREPPRDQGDHLFSEAGDDHGPDHKEEDLPGEPAEIHEEPGGGHGRPAERPQPE